MMIVAVVAIIIVIVVVFASIMIIVVVVASIMMIAGRFTMGMLIANFTATVANMNLPRSAYEKQLSIIKVCSKR